MPPAEDFRNLDSKHSTEIVNISSKIMDLLKIESSTQILLLGKPWSLLENVHLLR
jgi:hypothetical protein